jgi:DNA N-6-adenine-methyltransferase (Dam)
MELNHAAAGTERVRYDAACRALAEAVAIDDVKDIRDKAMAMQVYARQAKDETLIQNATKIRLRAERRTGEMLIELAERNERQKPGDASGGGDGSRAQPLPPKLSDLGISKTQSSRWQQLAALNAETFEAKVERASTRAYDRVVRGTQGTGQHEWFTPAEFLAVVRAALGTIDLDPASSDEAQQIVQATNYFTKEQDGLKKEWYGKVYLNPPYGAAAHCRFCTQVL